MPLYYQDDHVTIYHGDCREETVWLDADVLVTDPPYGMAFVSSWTTRKRPVAGDNNTDARDAALTAWGTKKPGIVFGTWRVPPPSANGNASSGGNGGRAEWATCRCRGAHPTRTFTCSALDGIG